jgi:hypothetical protein
MVHEHLDCIKVFRKVLGNARKIESMCLNRRDSHFYPGVQKAGASLVSRVSTSMVKSRRCLKERTRDCKTLYDKIEISVLRIIELNELTILEMIAKEIWSMKLNALCKDGQCEGACNHWSVQKNTF